MISFDWVAISNRVSKSHPIFNIITVMTSHVMTSHVAQTHVYLYDQCRKDNYQHPSCISVVCPHSHHRHHHHHPRPHSSPTPTLSQICMALSSPSPYASTSAYAWHQHSASRHGVEGPASERKAPQVSVIVHDNHVLFWHPPSTPPAMPQSQRNPFANNMWWGERPWSCSRSCSMG